MGRGIVAFLVLLAFVPSALHIMDLHQKQLSGVQETKQFFIEQQAITIKEQDVEESFWRVAVYSAPKGKEKSLAELSKWEKLMESDSIDIWYGDSGGISYPELAESAEDAFKPKIEVQLNGKVSVQGRNHDAVIVRTRAGNSTGIFLITQGSEHEYA